MTEGRFVFGDRYLLKLGSYTPRKLGGRGAIFLTVPVLYDGSGSPFKEKFLDCKMGKRLI